MPTRSRRAPVAWSVCAVIWVSASVAPASLLAQAQAEAQAQAPAQAPSQPAPSPLPIPLPVELPRTGEDVKLTIVQEVRRALVRLPLAAALGAALALRPRRRGTPPRQIAVVQTQIVLAGVGAVIMLIVGSSLARAFGIVGAANLIRYRSKIDDPKDAVVMLCALAVGLASGVGLYLLAGIATAFLLGLLWVGGERELAGRGRVDRLDRGRSPLRQAGPPPRVRARGLGAAGTGRRLEQDLIVRRASCPGPDDVEGQDV